MSLMVNQLVGLGVFQSSSLDSFTKLLLRGDGSNGSTTIVDSAGLHSPTAVGNAQISTAQSKFGGSSLLLDGTGDYITTPNSADFLFGASDFTIDCWLRPTALGTAASIFSTAGGAGVITALELYFTATTLVAYAATATGSWDVFSATNFGSHGMSTGNWYHFAFVRNGSNWAYYIDGVSKGTQTSSATLYTSETRACSFGHEFQSVGGAQGWNGHIDEYRVSKGIARWTTGFTPPTSAY